MADSPSTTRAADVPPISAAVPNRSSLDLDGTRASALAKLYAQSVRNQWKPDETIDWSLPVMFGAQLPPDPGLDNFLRSPLGDYGSEVWNRFRWEYQTWLVSQFYHGEQVALIGAARIAHTVSGLEAKQVAAVQAMDEARHIEVFGRYLDRHCPSPRYPIEPEFADLVSEALNHDSWDFALLGVQVLIEGVAVAAFRMAEVTLHDELIRSIIRMVNRDEARHTAFGQLSLRDVYADLSSQERAQRTQFLAAAAEVTMRRFLLEDVWARVGIDPMRGARFAANDDIMTAYRRTVFANVIRTIKHVGLYTSELHSDFQKLGFVRAA